MPEAVEYTAKLLEDDGFRHSLLFIFDRLGAHNEKHQGESNPPPFFLGINGVQGAGKTVLVSNIKGYLESSPWNLSTAVFSLDDIYLKHEDQVKLGQAHPDNPLLQHRGQPSTHDVDLGLSVFSALRQNQLTKIPQYNKAAFNGQGDRVPEEAWEEVNKPGEPPIKVVIFEGWAVGFRPLDDEDLRSKWDEAVLKREGGNYVGRLGYNRLEDVMDINEALHAYNRLTDQLDALIHIDAEDLQYVYKWRLEQEQTLRAEKGSGMTDDEVKRFVDGYYPSYELYTDTLRGSIFGEKNRRQFRLDFYQNSKAGQKCLLIIHCRLSFLNIGDLKQMKAANIGFPGATTQQASTPQITENAIVTLKSLEYRPHEKVDRHATLLPAGTVVIPGM